MLPDDPDLRHEVFLTGTSTVGLTEVGEDAWYALADRACLLGGWNHGMARALATEFAEGLPQKSDVIVDEMAVAVWLIAARACHELVPQGALKLGPPPGGEGDN